MKSLFYLTAVLSSMLFFNYVHAATITTNTLIYGGGDKHLIYNDILNDGTLNGPFTETNVYTENELLYGNGTSTMTVFQIQGRKQDEDVFLNYSYLDNGAIIDYTNNQYSSHWFNYTPWIESYNGSEFLWLNVGFLSPSGVTRQDFSWLNSGNTGTTSMYLQGTQPSQNPVPEPATMVLFGTGLLGLAITKKKLSKK